MGARPGFNPLDRTGSFVPSSLVAAAALVTAAVLAMGIAVQRGDVSDRR